MRCISCSGRVRPPKRPWTLDDYGRVHFYNAVSEKAMKTYAKWLERFTRRVPVVHEACSRPAGRHLVACDLEARRRRR